MSSQLGIYNGALLICGQTGLSSLTDDIEARYLLDNVWADPGYAYCLEQGQWNFAMRASKLDYDPAVTPNWGYTRAYNVPTDWVLWSQISSDEYFTEPLTRYAFERAYVYADLDSIYVQYVSDDASFGADLAAWPAAFTEYVKAYFAWKIVYKLSGGNADRVKYALGVLTTAERTAKNVDAMGEPTVFPPVGGWNASRRRGGGRSDRGNRGSLIG